MTMTWQLQLSEFSGVRPAPPQWTCNHIFMDNRTINKFVQTINPHRLHQTNSCWYDELWPVAALFVLMLQNKTPCRVWHFSICVRLKHFFHVKSHNEIFSHVMKVLLCKNPPIQGIKKSQWSNIVISGLALICLFTSTVSFAQRKRMKQHEATGNNTFVAKWRCPLSPFPTCRGFKDEPGSTCSWCFRKHFPGWALKRKSGGGIYYRQQQTSGQKFR